MKAMAQVLVFLFAASLTSAFTHPQSEQITAQEDTFLKGAFLPDTPDLVQPEVVWEKTPRYVFGALRAKIQGDVELQAVVLPNGRVDRVRVTTSLDKVYGLDESAMAALKEWRFKPGKLNGLPVPVVITVQLSFRTYCSGPGCK
jgi:TonB family protein